jgi:hypothetical protein
MFAYYITSDHREEPEEHDLDYKHNHTDDDEIVYPTLLELMRSFTYRHSYSKHWSINHCLISQGALEDCIPSIVVAGETIDTRRTSKVHHHKHQ